MGILFSPQLTPTQAKIGRAHRERWAKINAKSVTDKPIQLRPAKSDEAPEAKRVLPEVPPTDYAAYFARQEAINPIPKPVWFSIEEEIGTPQPRRVKIEEIQRAVAERYGVSRGDLLSSRRTANVVRPRQVAMYLSKKLTLRSLPEIGRRFGGRDHTTVLFGVRKIETLMALDIDLFEEVETLHAELGGGDGS